MQKEKQLDVLSICNVLKDIIIKVSDDDIKDLGLSKGIMVLISEEEQQNILRKFQDKEKKVELGGSGTNAMRTMAILGQKVSQTGMVGEDVYGDICFQRIEELGIKNNIKKSKIGNTGTSIILITPDGERTMNTCLGMSRNYTVNEIPEADIANSKYLHLTGYQWDTNNQIEAVNHAIHIAKSNNTKISFDLSDPFCVTRHKETFINIIDAHIDVVFANLKEASMLTDKGLDESLDMLSNMADIAVIKCGPEGSWIKTKTQKIKIPANKINVVDTTAAGDMYAGGFMYGLTKNLPLEECGKIANFCAETVIQQVGARVPENLGQLLKEHLQEKVKIAI